MLSAPRHRPGRLRHHWPVLVLTLGALAFGLLAWLESSRAEETAQVLVRGYAAFIADRFEEVSSNHFKETVGIHVHQPDGLVPTPMERLRDAAGRDGSFLEELSPGPFDYILYSFRYDSSDGLQTSGAPLPADERSDLLHAIGSIPDFCFSNRLSPIGQVEQWADGLNASYGWAGLVRTVGSHRQVFGFRVDQQALAEKLLFPLISPQEDCDCPSLLLPSDLSSIRDITQLATLTLRDEAGRIVHASSADKAAGPIQAEIARPLSSAIPFPGWTLEIAISPEASELLLPFRRGLPWEALALLGVIVGGSAALAVRALKRNAELLRLRQDFVSNVSHELKTPLARIRLFNELLMGQKQTDAHRRGHYRRVIDRECRRLTFLIENVLDFSRGEQGQGRHRQTGVDLRQLADEALETFRASTDPQKTSFSSRLDAVPAIVGDPVALQQAIINLLDNAAKYSPAGSAVEVRLSTSANRIRLEVQDRGCGIPKSEQERIFEKFYRIESGDHQEVSGNGLGLALVLRTAQQHGGWVGVDSQPGSGSTFTIELPCAKAAEADPSLAACGEILSMAPLSGAAATDPSVGH